MGHFCRICGRIRPNEQFSANGHKIHVCKKCGQLPKEEKQFIEEEQEIINYLKQSVITAKNIVRLKSLVNSHNPKIAKKAELVLEIGQLFPYKKKRFGRIARENKGLLNRLDEMGMVEEMFVS